MAGKVSKHCKNEDLKNSQPDINYPDGGWGWIIVLFSFLEHFIIGGLFYTFGIFLVDIMDTFDAGRSISSMIGSIQVGTAHLAGPIVADLVNKFGCRASVISGSVISATSLLISGMAPNIATLTVTAGFMTGFGFSLIWLPSITGIADYFDKKRAIATGIATSGTGFGMFVLAPTINFLNENLGWSWTIMIIGAVMLTFIPLGLLFQPMNRNKIRQSEGIESGEIGNLHELPTCKYLECLPTRYIVLLHDAKFMIFMLTNLLTKLAFTISFAFVQDRALTIGIEPSEASFLLSIIGISTIIGRIGLSALSDYPFINRIYLYSTCLMINGISLIASNFCLDYTTNIWFCIVFGVTFGGETGMTPNVLMDLVGRSKFSLGWGIQCFSMGIGNVIGPPIAGAIFDATGTHDGGFYFAGVAILTSSLLVFFLNVMKQYIEKDDEGVTYHNYSTEVENTCIQHPTCNQ